MTRRRDILPARLRKLVADFFCDFLQGNLVANLEGNFGGILRTHKVKTWSAANGGVTNGGLRGVCPPVLEIGRNRPFSSFFCLFRPFPEGPESTWKIQKTGEKGLFPQISLDLLKQPSLKPPFAAPQKTKKIERISEHYL